MKAQLSLNGYGEAREVVPVTLPRLAFMVEPDDLKEVAERITAMRIVRVGRDALETLNKAQSYDSWLKVGAALSIGKQWVLTTSGANCAWGSVYSKAFNRWLVEHGFTAIRPSDRSHAVYLHENRVALTAWRDSLPEHRRRRLIGAQAVVKRWRKTTQPAEPKPADVEQARAAWRRFVSCVEMLPPDQAAPLWQAAHAQAAAHV
jgi:hypothetical protein